MKKRIKELYQSQTIRYLFFGGLTVLVNLLFYSLFTDAFKWNINLSNALSIVLAILFAYIVNTLFVFCTKHNSIKQRLLEFFKFLCSRIFTMILEFAGVHLCVNILSFNDMVVKIAMQFVVIVVNYLLSAFVVYK